MRFRVVSLDDEKGWTRHAVVKPREDDPSVWVVLSWHATTYSALVEKDRLDNEYERLEESARQSTHWAPKSKTNRTALSHPPFTMAI